MLLVFTWRRGPALSELMLIGHVAFACNEAPSNPLQVLWEHLEVVLPLLFLSNSV